MLCEACQCHITGSPTYGATWTRRLVILAFSAVFMAAYAWCLISLSLPPPLAATIKALPAWILSAGVLIELRMITHISAENPHRKRVVFFNRMVTLGLILCGLGDFLLSAGGPDGSPLWFMSGLVSFLIGHLFFISGMIARINSLKEQAKPKPLPFVLACLCYLIVYLYVIYSQMTKGLPFKLALGVYGCAIGAMVSSAWTLRFQEAKALSLVASELVLKPPTDPQRKTYLDKQMFILKGSNQVVQFYAVASLFFLASDSTLGYTLFASPANREFAIMSTYWVALVLFNWAGMADLPCSDCLFPKDLGENLV